MQILPCHADSYRQHLLTEVVACTPAPGHPDTFQVELRETILYPGGGGQPADQGRVGGLEVLEIIENEPNVVRLAGDLPLGPTTIELDWARRFDLMQQHTAQHLITALAQRDFGLATTAFHLNPERSDIVLATPSVPTDVLAALAERVNAAIRAAHPVTPRFVTEAELASIRFRRLPGEHDGLLRVIEIEGVDRNTCGGTHVANTAELQAIFFTEQENRQGVTRLHWLAGGRVLAALHGGWTRGAELTALLRCNPAEQADAVARLLQQNKDFAKETKALSLEVAQALGEGLAATAGPVATLHRASGDPAFLSAVARAAQARRPDLLLLLTARSEGTAGCFLVAGPADRVPTLGPAVAQVLEGSGGGRGGLYQGKATRLDLHAQALERLLA